MSTPGLDASTKNANIRTSAALVTSFPVRARPSATALLVSPVAAQQSRPHNVILFIPDGLRALKVTPETAPTGPALPPDRGDDVDKLPPGRAEAGPRHGRRTGHRDGRALIAAGEYVAGVGRCLFLALRDHQHRTEPGAAFDPERAAATNYLG